ncbi:MAG: DUF1704 domain-containing protein [Candidatus Pacebacteria bacterium]|nr:DUF1704 domain-containing protein [Candidatus Paceibacterota bacterium]
MKNEQPKLEIIISEIKKVGEEKEVEDAVIREERETLSEVLEIPEEDVKKLEINIEEKEKSENSKILFEYAEKIYDITKDYRAVYIYLDNTDTKLINIEKLKEAINDLEEIQDEAQNRNEQIGNIINKIIFPEKAKIQLLLEFKNSNSEGVFENGKIAYGDIDEELCAKALDIYNDKLEFINSKKNLFKEIDSNNSEEALKYLKLAYKHTDEFSIENDDDWYKEKLEVIKKERQTDSIEEKLKKSKFNAEDIKNYFEIALIKGGLENAGYKVIIDSVAKSIGVYKKHPKYDSPVILIPENREVDGIKLLELIAHEIGGHIASGFYSNKQGLGAVSIGRDWETYNEGIAKKNEIEIKKEILENSYLNFKINSSPLYVLAMERIKNGGDFDETCDYIFSLKKKEHLAEGNDNLENEREAKKTAEKICNRVFRGFDKKEKGKYFTKDLAYLVGESGVREMKKTGVDKYLYLSKVDPKLIPDLIKMGVYTYEKGLQMTKDVAKQVWQDKDWLADYIKNKKWYEENTPEHLGHWNYRDKYMNENKTGLKSEE